MTLVKKASTAALMAGATVTAYAQEAEDPLSTIQSTITTVDSIWGVIATISIAVGAVFVGLRFLKKLGR